MLAQQTDQKYQYVLDLHKHGFIILPLTQHLAFAFAQFLFSLLQLVHAGTEFHAGVTVY